NRAPWDLSGEQHFPSRHFADRIHRFGWLRDLLAIGPDGAARARALTNAWIDTFGKWDAFAWRIDATAERVINWFTAGPHLFDELDDKPRSKLFESLVRQTRHLSASSEECPSPEGRARGAAALVIAGAALPDHEKMLDAGLARLEAVCQTQMLADGGHVNRNPEALANLLMDLHAAEDLLLRLGQSAPGFLSKAQNRMSNMLAFLATPDGGFLVSNGGGDGALGLAAAALGPHGSDGGRFAFARLSGYQRIEVGELAVYMDTGAAPDAPFAGGAHAGCLSMSLYDGSDAIITSCGANADSAPDWKAAARHTAAHSTLTLDDRDSAEFVLDDTTGRSALVGPEAVSARRLEENDQFLLEGQHGGWRETAGLIHRRRLYVAKDGDRITGEDALSRPVSEAAEAPDAPLPYQLRFHLHPNVQTAPGPDDKTVFLGLPGRQVVWRFKCDLGIRIEPSVYAASGARRRTQQIVVAGAADPLGDGSEAPNRVRWAMSRVQNSA
ncbi:MAG: heparinase II/III family protein, partial [Pseudomonadota bacterium]